MLDNQLKAASPLVLPPRNTLTTLPMEQVRMHTVDRLACRHTSRHARVCTRVLLTCTLGSCNSGMHM